MGLASCAELYPIMRFVPLPNILIHNSVPCCEVSMICYAGDFLLIAGERLCLPRASGREVPDYPPR